MPLTIPTMAQIDSMIAVFSRPDLPLDLVARHDAAQVLHQVRDLVGLLHGELWQGAEGITLLRDVLTPVRLDIYEHQIDQAPPEAHRYARRVLALRRAALRFLIRAHRMETYIRAKGDAHVA